MRRGATQRVALGVFATLVTSPPPVSASGQTPNQPDAEPWVVVDRPEPERFDKLNFPHILVRSDGSYVATVEHVGHRGPQIGTSCAFRTSAHGPREPAALGRPLS